MLTITIINDSTGTDDAANYHYEIAINWIIVGEGRIKGHNRADGWRALVREMVAPGLLDACESAHHWLEWEQYQGGGDETWVVDKLSAAIAQTEEKTVPTIPVRLDPPERPPLEQEHPRQLPTDLKMQIHEMNSDMHTVRDIVRYSTVVCVACGPDDYCEAHKEILAILGRWIGDAS